MKLSIATLILALLFCLGQLHAGEPDVELEMSVAFRIEPARDTGYSLWSRTSVTQTYLSKRSTAMHLFPVSEQFYDPISEFRASFRGHELKEESFSVENGGGEDAFISDFRVQSVTFPSDIAVGEKIFFEYRKDYTSPAFVPIIEVPNVDYVKSYSVTFTHPADITVDFDFFFPRGAIPYTLDRSKPGETTLSFKDLHLPPPLVDYPFDDMQAAVQIRLARGGKPLTPTTDADFTAWYRALFDQSPSIGPRYDTLLAGELAATKSNREKVKVIHDFVRRNIRYIADEQALHAFVPRNPSLVLERGYGDCKDRAYLVSTLARRQGLRVNMTLLSTDPRPDLPGVHVTQFNHVICEYADGRDTLFFDPTHKYCEFGNLPESDIGADVLILDPDHPRRTVIPAPNRTPSLDVAITASIDNPKQAKARLVMRNDFFQDAVESQERLKGLELENVLSNMVSSQFQKIAFDYFELESQGEDSIAYRAVADISDFIISSTAKKYLPQMPFHMIDPEVLEREKDSLAIFNLDRSRIAMHIDLEAPAYRAEPAKIAFGGDPATFSASLAPAAVGHLWFDYRLLQYGKRMEGASRASYLEFCKSFLKSKKNMFIVTRTEP